MIKQEEYIGFESINQLAKALSSISPRKIFLVTGKQSFEESGAKRLTAPILKNYSVTLFAYGEPNPKIVDIEQGVAIYTKEKPNLVIAIGGGSVIDTAKMIKFFASNDIAPRKWLNGEKTTLKEHIPLIAVPTTSGSGSEATHFAVVYIEKEKYSIEHESMLPSISIVDPIFTMNLSPYITASSGMDALSQAIESYWSIHSTEESKELAAQAIKLIISNIASAVNTPTPDSRLAMAKGAHLAGKAIKLTKTTAVHAISYPITSYYGITHGHACGLILPGMFHFISGVTEKSIADARGPKYVIKTLQEIAFLLGESKIKSGPQKLCNLLQEIGLEINMSTLGIQTENDIAIIVDHGFNPQRVKNNPRKLTRKNLRQILCTPIASYAGRKLK